MDSYDGRIAKYIGQVTTADGDVEKDRPLYGVWENEWRQKARNTKDTLDYISIS